MIPLSVHTLGKVTSEELSEVELILEHPVLDTVNVPLHEMYLKIVSRSGVLGVKDPFLGF